MEVLTENRQQEYSLSLNRIQEKAKTILSVLGYPDVELSILLVDDAEIARLNAQYLGKPEPTNVLAFPMDPDAFPEVAPKPIGDVVVSVETAHREGEEAGIDMAERIGQLLIHGILHLTGYDHIGSAGDALVMEQKAAELEALIQCPS